MGKLKLPEPEKKVEHKMVTLMKNYWLKYLILVSVILEISRALFGCIYREGTRLQKLTRYFPKNINIIGDVGATWQEMK